jgi:hypothetical protein
MADDRVAILHNVTRGVVGYCAGPAPAGHCCQAGPGRVVACAGRRIAAPDAGPAYWLMEVPPGSRHCPLAWDLDSLGIF